MRSIRLTAAATSTLPRFVLVLITAIYGLLGIFGRDPWKNDDAAGFGAMWTLANGSWIDWLLPHIDGRSEILAGPLPYWLGASLIGVFGPLMGPTNAAGLYSAACFFLSCIAIWHASYLLGRRPEVQPSAFALGGQPKPRDYGRTLADSALMIFLACIGLALRAHETTPALAQLLGVSTVLYGMVRGLDKPLQGGSWTGLGLAVIALSASLWLFVLIFIGLIISLIICEVKPHAKWLASTWLVALLGIGVWPFLWWLSDLSTVQMQAAWQAWWSNEAIQLVISGKSSGFLARNLPLYAWPVWPLALWSIWFWRKGANNPLGGIRNPNMALPLGIVIAVLVYLTHLQALSEQSLLLIIPPLVIWACFSLPIIKRSVISFIDWFALLTFTLVGAFIWVMWFAMTTNLPAGLARNIAKKVPGFVPEFSWLALIAAIVVTALWVSVVKWRTSRAPKVIWRAVVISAAGTTLTWVLLMTLWLPTINYAKTYRDVAQRLVQVVPSQSLCINSTHLGDGQLASFIYFTKLKFKDDVNCDLWISNQPGEARKRAKQLNKNLELIWEDRRVSDRSERLRLYKVLSHAQ
jgi:4-amino-4-deoxy-L-arabinose transferase-like glycosyltransferase